MPAHTACAVSLQEEIEVVEEQQVLRLRRGGNYHSLPSLRGSATACLSVLPCIGWETREKKVQSQKVAFYSVQVEILLV